MSTKIEITDAKNVEDLKNKLAYELKTSPEFLYISGDSLNNTSNSLPTKFVTFKDNKQSNIQDYTKNTRIVIDIFNYVENMDIDHLFDVSVDSDIVYLTKWDDDSNPLFMPLYLYKLYQDDSLKNMIAVVLAGMSGSNVEKLREYFDRNTEDEIISTVQAFEKNRQKWLEEYQKSIKISQISELTDESDIKYTKEILSQIVTVTIDTSTEETQYFNLDVMFNTLLLNNDYKLAIYKDLAKIHKDLEHTVNINYNTFNSIHIYPNIYSEYSEPEIRVYIDDDYNIKIASINKGAKDKIVQIISKLFNLDPGLIDKSAEISNITGAINYENKYINKYILLDLILNKKFLSEESHKEIVSKFSTNEKIFTDKMFSSRIFFKTKSNKIIVANVKQICNTVTSKPPHAFKNCNKNLQVNIAKCKDDNSLSEFLYYFNNLITVVYDGNKDNIIQSYEAAGININIINDDSQLTLSANDVPCKLEKGSEEKQFFATLYPYLFKPEIIIKSQHKDDFRNIESLKGTDYLSSCSKKPIVISEEEARNKIEQNNGVIPDSLVKYPTNTIKMPTRSDIPSNKPPFIYPIWFYCKNKADMEKSGELENASERVIKSADSTSIGFIGRNTITPTPGKDLVTGETVPLKLPCCYKPRTKSTSSSKLPNSKTGNSMVKDGFYGDLPPLILDLIKNAAKDTELSEIRFNRLGVVSADSPLSPMTVRDSFFKCMLIATENDYNEDDIKKSLILYSPIAKQSLPDMTVDEIYEKYFSENATEYIDPFYFLQMFEVMFNVGIIVLRRDNFGDEQQITNVVPYYRHLLYKNQYESISQSIELKRKTVLIYEHRGGAPTPFYSCELIVAQNDAEIIARFNTNRGFIENITECKYYCFDCYSLENKLKAGRTRNEPDIWKWDAIIKFEKQYIDEYGKTRQLLGKLRSQKYAEFMFILNVSPIEPLPIICVSDTKLRLIEEILPIDFDILYSEIYNSIPNVSKGTPYSPYIDYSKDLLKGEFGLVQFSIERKISNLSLEKSELDKYKLYKNTALSLKSLFIWLFSKFMANTDDVEKTMDNFLNLNTIIEENCYYNNPTEFLSFDKNPGYFIDNKLKLESINIRNRLVYYLNIACKNQQKINNYKNRHIIEGYFDNIENYNTYDDQIISKVLSSKYNTNNNIKSLQIIEWLEKIINKPLTESFEILMLYGTKLAEAVSILENNIARSLNKPIKLSVIQYVDLDLDDKNIIESKIRNNIGIYNNFINSNQIPNKDNYILEWNKFKREASIRKNIKNIYNSIYAIQKFFKDIPSFINKSIKDKILYNNKHRIHKNFQKYESNVYFHSNGSNSISLCYNATNIQNSIKCGKLWNDTGMFDNKNLNNPKIKMTDQSLECLFPVNKNAYITKKVEYKEKQNKTTASSLENSPSDDDSVATEYEDFIDLEEQKVPEIEDNKTVKIAYIYNSPEITTIMN
jgi:hypothetical protein